MKKRILIVDDSSRWVLYHKDAVREIFGGEAEIDTASSAKEGVERLMSSIDCLMILFLLICRWNLIFYLFMPENGL